MSAVPILNNTATINGINGNGIGNGANSYSCACPMDVFGTNSSESAAIPMERTLPTTNCANPCSSLDSLVALNDQVLRHRQ
jgi:hypothetical protein